MTNLIDQAIERFEELRTTSYEEPLVITDEEAEIITDFLKTELQAFIQDLLDKKAREIDGLIEKYQKSEEVTVNGQRFLIVGGLKKKFGYPFPDTKEKYLIREIKQALSILKEK